MDYNDLPSDHKYFLSHEMLMGRCIQLAVLGSGFTAPNPMVGAILVYEGRIIGEGYHKMHGGPHAEVNCIHSVKPEDRFKIPLSTLYVSLEPCCHHGKTPPCTDLIIEQKIPKVIIGCRDPFPAVNGKGIDKINRKRNRNTLSGRRMEFEGNKQTVFYISSEKTSLHYFEMGRVG